MVTTNEDAQGSTQINANGMQTMKLYFAISILHYFTEISQIQILHKPYSRFIGETIRVFRRSRSGRPMSGTPSGQGTNSKGDEQGDDPNSSKHVEDLPAPDTPAAAKDAGIK